MYKLMVVSQSNTIILLGPTVPEGSSVLFKRQRREYNIKQMFLGVPRQTW